MRKVGLLGGSFNPVHVGHIMLASYMSQYTCLDEVWLVLSPSNPLKDADILIDDNHRMDMLETAIGDNKHIYVCGIELTMPRPSYTINTLDQLRCIYPDVDFRLIIGSDNWLIFDKWKDSQRIIKEYGVMVYPRPGYEVEIDDIEGVEFINAPVVNLSSTFIRDGLAQNKDMGAFLPNGVNEYILKHSLYKNSK